MHRTGMDWYWQVDNYMEISGKIKWEYFQAVAVSVLLYGCIIWILIRNLKGTTQECFFEQILKQTLENNSFTATNLPSQKQSK